MRSEKREEGGMFEQGKRKREGKERSNGGTAREIGKPEGQEWKR